MSAKLPEGYEALESFVDRWSVEGIANRAQLRSDSTADERQAFYDAVKNVAAPALDMLDKKPLSQLDASEKRLMNLLLSFAHVALTVEVQGDDEPRHASYRKFMRLTRSPADVDA
jgi:hypothetical protein